MRKAMSNASGGCRSNPLGRLFLAAAIVSSLMGCATTSTTTSTWVDPATTGNWARPGHVESVQEIVRRVDGDPAGGAVAGALIGGFLFGHHGRPSLFGAAAGAAVGASSSQGHSETRSYQVLVRFDDGGYATFVYGGYSPFRPGEPVVLTPQGLTRG